MPRLGARGRRGARLGRNPDRLPSLDGQNLGAVGAGSAVGRRRFAELLGRALGEGLQHQGMIAEIVRADELGLRAVGRHHVGEAADAVDENPGEQEVGEHHRPAVAELRHMPQARLDQREGDAGIAHLAPAEAHALMEQPRDLGDVGVGVGIRGAAADHHEAGVVDGALPRLGVGALDRLAHALPGGGDQLRVDAELASAAHLDPVLRGVGVEHGRDVVLRVHGREQHSRNAEDAPASLFAQPVEAVADDGVGELQVAVLQLPVGRQQRRQPVGEGGELVDRRLAARAVTAENHASLHVSFPLHCARSRKGDQGAGGA